MGQFHTVCRTDEVHAGEGKTVAVGNKLIAVFRVGEEFHAIDDACPHMGASLAGGHLENNIVTCPWHAWRFRVTDGAWADNPRVKTNCSPVRVADGALQVELPDGVGRTGGPS